MKMGWDGMGWDASVVAWCIDEGQRANSVKMNMNEYVCSRYVRSSRTERKSHDAEKLGKSKRNKERQEQLFDNGLEKTASQAFLNEVVCPTLFVVARASRE